MSGGASPWRKRRCPDCRAGLDGGPVHYYCWVCSRAWYAADVDAEIERTGGAGTG
jgi:hypothetical protein